MRKRLIYGSGVAFLVLLVGLVVWQGSLNYGVYRPEDTAQTVILWAVSTLIFLLMATLGFMLVRDGVKLFVERRSNRAGSRIKTKLVIGALALSIMPVLFMLFFSFTVMSHNLERWFTEPVDIQRADFIQIANALTRELQDKVNAQAALLASLPETRLQLAGGKVDADYLKRFCDEQKIAAASVQAMNSPVPIASCGTMPRDYAVGRHAVYWAAREIGSVRAVTQVPIDVRAIRQEIERYNADYLKIKATQHAIRQHYMSLLCLISLFIVFIATWIALFLSKQISVPIAALANAAQEVGRGNLAYRVQVGANDELAGLVLGFNRMTEQLEGNARELDARRRFTEAILENIPTGVISMSADGGIQRVNRALRGILPAELVASATRLEDLFPREDAAEIRYLMKRARRTGIAAQQLDLKFGSQTLHLAVTVSALEDRSSSGFVMVIEDTSDLLRAQKAAAWNEVARRIAHEIKNPLTPIGLSAERIQRQLDRTTLPADIARIIRECTGTIVNEVQSVKSLVDEFSQFARFPAPQPVTSSLNSIVESALAVFSGRLDGIEIRTDFAPSLLPVLVDREQFKRVVVNLIDNAAEAMQDSPLRRLHIITQPGPADSVELVIADTGAGVSGEDKEKLFVPYFSTKGRGTGLGLAIVNNILSDHNAHIRVEDNSPAGTRFTIEIPTEEMTSDAAPGDLVAGALTKQ
ncbi:MAG: multi-sensor signal transduction histidine kinase [Bryobacterales bacterium]|nr:multi-sensor signal transduction histidine kinase [Bryobacterales bacterium]